MSEGRFSDGDGQFARHVVGSEPIGARHVGQHASRSLRSSSLQGDTWAPRTAVHQCMLSRQWINMSESAASGDPAVSELPASGSQEDIVITGQDNRLEEQRAATNDILVAGGLPPTDYKGMPKLQRKPECVIAREENEAAGARRMDREITGRRPRPQKQSGYDDGVYATQYGYQDGEFDGYYQDRHHRGDRYQGQDDYDYDSDYGYEHDLSESDYDSEFDDLEGQAIVDPVGRGLEGLDDCLVVKDNGELPLNQDAVRSVMQPKALGPPPGRFVPGSATSRASAAAPSAQGAPPPSQVVSPPALSTAAPGAVAGLPAATGGVSAPTQPPARAPVHPAIKGRVRTTQELVLPPVEQSLAEHIIELFDYANLEPLSLKLTEVYERTKRPENLPVLLKTEINPEIYQGLSDFVTDRDSFARSAQHASVRAASVIAVVLDKLFEIHTVFKREDMPDDLRVKYAELPQIMIDHLLDGIICLAYAGNRINLVRRILLKPHLQYQFRFLCDRVIAAYANLLGDDLEAVIKKTTDNRRTAATIVFKPRGIRRGRRRGRGRGGRGRKRPFLGEFSFSSHVSGLIDDFHIPSSSLSVSHDFDVQHLHSNVAIDANVPVCQSVPSFSAFSTPDETLFVRNCPLGQSCQSGACNQLFSLRGEKREGGEGGMHVKPSSDANQCECYSCRPEQGARALSVTAERTGPRPRRSRQEKEEVTPGPATEIQQQLSCHVGNVCFNYLNISDQLSTDQPPFRGGALSYHYAAWKSLTSDPEVLQYVRGTPLNFVSPPIQARLPHEIIFNQEEQQLVRAELDKFLEQDIIDETVLCPGDYCSNLFTRPKKTPGSIRCILSLKKLNKFVRYIHFKMETLQTILLLLRSNMYMTSFDLSQSFYHIKVRPQDLKYLKFVSLGQYWVMKNLPMGYRDSPRVFTRLTKVPIHYFRQNFFWMISSLCLTPWLSPKCPLAIQVAHCSVSESTSV